MLVLSRRIGQEIVLPTLGITITVLRNNRNQVRLGIEAPREIRVVRSDIAHHMENLERDSKTQKGRKTLPCRPGLDPSTEIDPTICSVRSAS